MAIKLNTPDIKAKVDAVRGSGASNVEGIKAPDAVAPTAPTIDAVSTPSTGGTGSVGSVPAVDAVSAPVADTVVDTATPVADIPTIDTKVDTLDLDLDTTTFKAVAPVNFVKLSDELEINLRKESSPSARQQLAYDTIHNTVVPHLKQLGLGDIHRHFDGLRTGAKTLDSYSPKQQVALKGVSHMYRKAYNHQISLQRKANPNFQVGDRGEWYYPSWTDQMNQSKLDKLNSSKHIWEDPLTSKLSHFRANTDKVAVDDIDPDVAMSYSIYASSSYNDLDMLDKFAKQHKQLADELGGIVNENGDEVVDVDGVPVVDEISEESLQTIAEIKAEEFQRLQAKYDEQVSLIEKLQERISQGKDIEDIEQVAHTLEKEIETAYADFDENGVPSNFMDEIEDGTTPTLTEPDLYKALGLKKPTKAEEKAAAETILKDQTSLYDDLKNHQEELEFYLDQLDGVKITTEEAVALYGKGWKGVIHSSVIDDNAPPLMDTVSARLGEGATDTQKASREKMYQASMKLARQKVRDIWHAERNISKALKDPDVLEDARTKVLADKIDEAMEARGLTDPADLFVPKKVKKEKAENPEPVSKEEIKEEKAEQIIKQTAREASEGEAVRKVNAKHKSDYVKRMMRAKAQSISKLGQPMVARQHIIYSKTGAGSINAGLDERLKNVMVKMNRGGSVVESSLWDLSGAKFHRSIHAISDGITANILESGVQRQGEFDLTALAAKLTDIFDDTSSQYGLGKLMLTSSQKKFLAEKMAKDIDLIQEHVGDHAEYFHTMSAVIKNGYKRAYRMALNNIIDQGLIMPRKAAEEIDPDTGSVFPAFDRATENIVQDLYDVFNNDVASMPKFLQAVQKLMYASALGGITRGAVQNMLEPLTMLTVKGYNPAAALASLRGLTGREYKEYIDKYGEALGIKRIMNDDITGDGASLDKPLFDKAVDLTTVPFRKSQELGMIAHIVGVEHLVYKEMYGHWSKEKRPTLNDAKGDPEFTARVVEQSARFMVMNDTLGQLRLFRNPYIRAAFMFVPYTFKHWGTLKRIYNHNMATSTTATQKAMANVRFFSGLMVSKTMMQFVMGLLGVSTVSAIAANPFNIMDDRISPIPEEERNELDKILANLPLPMVVNSLMDIYYSVRKEQIDNKDKGLFELMTDEGARRRALFDVSTNIIPAWGTINRMINNADAWNTGVVRSKSGTVKFETDMDAFNFAISLIAGQNATRAGKLYTGLYDPIGAFVDKYQRTEGDVFSRLGASTEAVYHEMDKLINENGVGEILGSGVEFLKSKLQGKGYNIFSADDVNQLIDGAENPKYKEWRAMVSGEYGSQFTGRETLDSKIWGQEIQRLGLEYDKVSTKIEKLNGQLMSNDRSEESKQAIQDEITSIKEAYDKKFSDLVNGYARAGHTIDEQKRGQLRWLAGYGEDTPNSDNDTALRQDYINRMTQGLRIAKEDQALSTTSTAQSLKAGQNISRELTNNRELKRLRKEAMEATDDIWDRINKEGRKPTSAEYARINEIAQEYMGHFDKVALPLINKNGGNMLLNYNNIIDELAKYAIVPRSEWAEYSYVNKRGKERKEFISSKKFPHVEADLKSLFQERYGFTTSDKVIMGGQSSLQATRELTEAYRLMESGNPSGMVHANRLYERYLNGTRQLTETQADQLRTMLGKRTY